MRSDKLVVALVGLLLGMTLVFLGVFLLLTPFIPIFAHATVELIVSHLRIVSLVGLFFFCMGVFFLMLCAFLSRRRYLLLQMGGAAVEDCLIQQLAKQGLVKLFPNQPITCDVVIHKRQKVEIFANIPYVSEEKQKQTFEQIEAHLTTVLRRQCQLKKEFIFNVGFLPPKGQSNNCKA